MYPVVSGASQFRKLVDSRQWYYVLEHSDLSLNLSYPQRRRKDIPVAAEFYLKGHWKLDKRARVGRSPKCQPSEGTPCLVKGWGTEIVSRG